MSFVADPIRPSQGGLTFCLVAVAESILFTIDIVNDREYVSGALLDSDSPRGSIEAP